MTDDLELQDLLDELFTGNDPAYGSYQQVGKPEVVIPDRLVNVVLRQTADTMDMRNATIFLGLREIGGELWQHEVRSLIRLRMLGHPALPEIEDGRFDHSRGVAYIMTRFEGAPLHDEWRELLTEWAPSQPVVMFEQFSLLADALCRLHGTRIMHRNLSLRAIRVRDVPGNDDAKAFSLARFEVSALVNNLLHTVFGEGGRVEYEEIVRRLYLEPPASMTRAHHLAYLPPERHAHIFLHDVGFRRLDHGSTDVFGLGVFGWEAFIGPIVDRLPEECAAVERASSEDLPAALTDLHTAMRRTLEVSATLPRHLRNALLKMLEATPSQRHTSFEASGELQRHWTEISVGLAPETINTTPKLLAFMPYNSVETIHKTRGWTDHPPDTPEGIAELRAFLEDELRNAELVYCHQGAVGFIERTGDNRSSLAKAKWVLIGEQAVWFCAFHYDRATSGASRTINDDTLVIRYLTDKRFATEILNLRPRRRIGKVDLVPFRRGQPLDDYRVGRPSWSDLTKAVKTDKSEEDGDVDALLRQAGFTLQYRGLVHRARQYPFRRRVDNDGRILLIHDKDKDRALRHEDPLYTAFAAVAGGRLRPSLGAFAEQLLAESPVPILKLGDDRPAPYFGGDAIDVALVACLDDDTIVVRPINGKHILWTRGWLRPRADIGTAIQLRREGRALELLRQRRGLAKVLRSPRSIDLQHQPTEVLPIPLAPDVKPLMGRGPDIVDKMLRLHPFFALQGPPGTGKSTIVSRALHRYLTTEHGARVLVSAQSNDALNQLATKVIALLKPAIDDQSVLVLRELSRTKDESDLPEPLRPLTAENIARNLVARLKGRADGDFGDAVNDHEIALVKRWASIAEEDMVELVERVRVGADVVFATCSIAGALTDEVREPVHVFDWVIVEEAAKAWPTEILMPLVSGVRWTLIGDHRQLGPHRAQDMTDFLDQLEEQRHDDVAVHYAARDGYEKFIRLFEGFFTGAGNGGKSPVDFLATQFRMHPAIAEPFARAFYDDRIEPGPEMETKRVHGRTYPPYLTDAPLVWLDTSGDDDCRDEGFWYNPGEVRLVNDLVRDLKLDADRYPGRLVVLTPYRHQVDRLDRDFLRGRVHTIHSFQGGEADVAIVSLVRSKARGDDIRQNIGHTASPEVINVMLSRARELMVIVGNLTHFEQHGGPDWAKVITAVREVGRIVDATTGEVVG